MSFIDVQCTCSGCTKCDVPFSIQLCMFVVLLCIIFIQFNVCIIIRLNCSVIIIIILCLYIYILLARDQMHSTLSYNM